MNLIKEFIGIKGRMLHRRISIPNIRGPEILDFGCGTGWFLDMISKKGYILSGLEVRDEYINLLKNKYTMYKTTPVDKMFDTICSFSVLNMPNIDEDELKQIIEYFKSHARQRLLIISSIRKDHSNWEQYFEKDKNWKCIYKKCLNGIFFHYLLKKHQGTRRTYYKDYFYWIYERSD